MNLELSHSQLIDTYNITTWAYAPLTGFLNKADTQSVLKNMHLSTGELWSIPILLHVDEEVVKQIENEKLTLTYDNQEVATLEDPEVYQIDRDTYCDAVFATRSLEHPGVKKIQTSSNWVVGGRLHTKTPIQLNIPEIDEKHLLTPEETKKHFREHGFETVCAFQTRNPPHRGHEYIQKCSLEQCDALLIHPVVGEKKSGDFRDTCILGAYEKLTESYYNQERTLLSCLPWTMRYAGPKEAIMHAIIRQNFGCTHIIIGRDHAGVGDFYGTYDAQKIFTTIEKDELDIQILAYENASFCTICRTVTSHKTCPHEDKERIFISGTNLRKKIQQDEEIPRDFMRQPVQDYLKSIADPFVD